MFTSAQIADRIKFVCSQKGITIGGVLEKAALGRNTMANLKTSMPKIDTLSKIADVLDCSLDFLTGRTSYFQNEITAPVQIDEGGSNIMLLAGRDGQQIKIQLSDEQYDMVYKMFCSFPDADNPEL